MPTRMKPESARLLDQGRSMLRVGQHRDALEIADRLLVEPGETPETLLFAADVQFTRANFVESERLAGKCCDKFPAEHGGPVMRARALLGLRRLGEARDLALSVIDKDITDELQLGALVMVLTACMVPNAAYPLCRRWLERDPDNIQVNRQLAIICRLTGKIDEALHAADIVLRNDTRDYEMIGLRSTLFSATREKNHVAELAAILGSGCRNPLDSAKVAYALAKECEEIGDFERSFGYLDQGAKFKRQTLNYRIEEDLGMMETVQSTFTADALNDTGTGFDTHEPIFILGLPRTGSTLIERIISSHSAVYAAGELRHFSGAIMEQIRRTGPLTDRDDLVRKSLQVDMHEVGRRYIDKTRPATGHTPYFIDKLPLNCIYIGLIRLALPNARIIHLQRTPLDACYAIYKFLFNQAYSWSYDLDEIAQYYVAYRQLMDHWHEVLPNKLIDAVYENVVDDLEGQAKQLIAALDLEWEPACLEFHENQAAAMTGSAVQVRRKIYSSSVGRWRDYEDQLKPLADNLEAAGIDPYVP